ncbi:hypothetical protein SAMN05216378_4032 [Paenibacillus catalpae]|uniref:Uncharacterized protein n=1 Tax=Paenibacillus catalpae TaxID=1045775 RepID=A0A1I2DAF0_9BACL|nr:hypothetical protein SAMN05216378_4032 [Paenibacillus catalpae]
MVPMLPSIDKKSKGGFISRVTLKANELARATAK